MRRLIHSRLHVEGATTDHHRTGPVWDEYWVIAPALRDTRPNVVRIYHSNVDEAAVPEIEEVMSASGAVNAVLVATQPYAGLPAFPDRIRVASPAELVSRIVGSSQLTWND